MHASCAIALAALLSAGPATAAPQLSSEVLEALVVAEGAWVDTLIEEGKAFLPYDEQIFTEISPILDAPDAIRLPEDQQLPE